MEALKVEVGQSARNYLLYVPAGLQPGAALLIAFHPSRSNADEMRQISGAVLERLARDRGFAIAYPEGYEEHFNDCRKVASYSARTQNIDDVGFTRAIVADVVKRADVNPDRVYILGFSNGAHMAFRLAMEAPDLVAGVIAIAANLPTAENTVCRFAEGRAVPVVFINGTKDPINPYEGGDVTIFGSDDRGNVLSAVQSAQLLAERYGLHELQQMRPPLEVRDLLARWRDWGRPDKPQARVRLITIEEGGHTIPQAKFDFPARLRLGKTFRSDVPLESAFDAIGLPGR
ncbi:MAG: dienelactone hydrolase family protein [Burkholderiaceae bacterium]|nr:dienelactone hydrolase family protein [Burkholderiaceae bacterium]